MPHSVRMLDAGKNQRVDVNAIAGVVCMDPVRYAGLPPPEPFLAETDSDGKDKLLEQTGGNR